MILFYVFRILRSQLFVLSTTISGARLVEEYDILDKIYMHCTHCLLSNCNDDIDRQEALLLSREPHKNCSVRNYVLMT